MIFHLIAVDEWESFRATDRVDPGGVPFLHMCTEAQLSGVVARYFSDVGQVVALEVDERKLGNLLRWEPGVDPASGRQTDDGELFPHVYGPFASEQVEAAYAVLPNGRLGRRMP